MFKFLFLLIILFIIFALFSKNKKKICLLTFLLFTIYLALRSETMGLNDTSNIYHPLFNVMDTVRFTDILTNSHYQDFGFFTIFKIIKVCFDNYRICLAILAAIYVFCILKFIYKYSSDVAISIIIFLSMYLLYGTYLLRQVIAIGIILLSYKYIKSRNIKKFGLTVIFASFFHKTALIFFIAYPFCKFNRFGKKNYIYILICYLIVKYAYSFLIKIIPLLDFTGKVEMALTHHIYTIGSGNFSMLGILLNVLILIITAYFSQFLKDEKEKQEVLDICNILTLGIMLFCCYNVVAEFSRIALYFLFFNIIAIPNALKDISSKNRKKIKLLISVLFLMYFFTKNINNMHCNPYLFFWEG